MGVFKAGSRFTFVLYLMLETKILPKILLIGMLLAHIKP